jgi:NAD(P)-dependent dehydrogenase (short-subunit alcohol dehydrogenase family)
MLRQGACVVLADIDEESLDNTVTGLSGAYGRDVVRGVACDVTKEESVTAAIDFCSVAFGGMDIVVSNAGIASSAPLDQTSLEMWDRNMGILVTGYFLASREAFKVLKAQDTGGSIVMVASKNALVASPNAVAYCTAKAAEVQLARAVALEGAPIGVRCNVVNPDAVLTDSGIWKGTWREERAAAYGIEGDELEEHYRQRSLLKRHVLPEDIAEAIYFFASDVSDKSTGNILNVDAGHAPSFTR